MCNSIGMSPYKVHAFLKGKFPISQYYGENQAYYAQFGLQHGHEGVDIATPNGTEIYSPLNGIIVRDVMNDKDYGNFVVIWDPVQKCAVWFCHLQDVLVNPSDTVQAGQLLGHTNNTGNTTGPHVHVNFVETDDNGYRLNIENGEQGFLNLLDTSLVSIIPFPGIPVTDDQTPIPNEIPEEETATVQTQDANQPVPAPVPPAADPQTPADVGGGGSLPPNYDQIVANSTTCDAICDYLKIPRNSSQAIVLNTLQQREVDLTTKVQTLSDKYTTDLGNYQVIQAGGYSTLSDIDTKLEGVTKDNVGLQKQILQVTKSNEGLAEQLKAKNNEDSTAIEMGLEAQSKVKELESTLSTIARAHGTKPNLTSILSAIDKLKGLYEQALRQIGKKNIKQDIQAVQQVTQDAETIASTIKKPNALDDFAALFEIQGKVVK